MERNRSFHCIASMLHQMFSIRRPLMTDGKAQQYPLHLVNMEDIHQI
jgi:hypothetical protein